MAMLTIRNLDDGIKERLRVRAAMHGHSMEEEARVILKRAVDGIDGKGLWALSRQVFGSGEGIELQLPRRDGDRPASAFSDDDAGGR